MGFYSHLAQTDPKLRGGGDRGTGVPEEGKTDVQGHSVGFLPGPSLLHAQKPEFHTSLTFAAHLWDGELGTWVNDQLESKSPLPPGHTSLGVRRPGFMSQLGHFLIARLVTCLPWFSVSFSYGVLD